MDVAAAVRALKQGGVIAFPTDTVYGLGALAGDELAQRRIYRIKGRPVGMPLIMLAASAKAFEDWVEMTDEARTLGRKFWPGPLTLVLHATSGGTLGVRIPQHETALELLRKSGPLMTTSANLHGKDPALTAEDAAHLEGVAGVIDGGKAPGGDPSTVLDLTGARPHILRPGPLDAEQLGL